MQEKDCSLDFSTVEYIEYSFHLTYNMQHFEKTQFSQLHVDIAYIVMIHVDIRSTASGIENNLNNAHYITL